MTQGDHAANRPRTSLVVARLGLAAILLAYVLTRVDWGRMAGYRHTVSWPWLAAFVSLIPAGHVVSSAKWRMLLRAGGHEVGLWRLTGLYMVGQFYNAVFPSTIGGDVVRSLGLREVISDTRMAFASTVAERFTGAAVLVALGAVAVIAATPDLWATRDGALDGRLALLMAAGAMGVASLVIVSVLSDRALGLLRKAAPGVEPFRRGLDRLERFQRALIDYRDQPAVMARAIAYSVLFYAITICLIYAGARITGPPGATLGLPDAAVITPIILLIALLPLTPGGYGVVQWAYMVTFLAFDVPEAATLGIFVSLAVTAGSIAVSATGYALYALHRAFEGGGKRSGEGGVRDTP